MTGEMKPILLITVVVVVVAVVKKPETIDRKYHLEFKTYSNNGKKDEMLFEKANNLTFDFRNPLIVLYIVKSVQMRSFFLVWILTLFTQWHFCEKETIIPLLD